MWKEAQLARKSPVNLNVKSHLISSSHVSHSRQSVKKSLRTTDLVQVPVYLFLPCILTPPGGFCSVVCFVVQFLIAGTSPQKSISARREQVKFSMAIGNEELMHECFPKHPRIGTARQKLDDETYEKGQKRRINVGGSTADTKKEVLSSHLVEPSRKSLTTVRLEVQLLE